MQLQHCKPHPGVLCHYFKGYFWNCTEISILLSGQKFCSIKVKILPSFAIMCALRTNLCKFFFYVTDVNSLSMYLCDKCILSLSCFHCTDTGTETDTHAFKMLDLLLRVAEPMFSLVNPSYQRCSNLYMYCLPRGQEFHLELGV